MRLSVVNTLLRDRYSSLEALCEGESLDCQTLCDSLAAIDYHYDRDTNQFL